MLRPLLALASLVLLDASAERIAFAPAKELELSKRFTLTLTQELDELSILAGGIDMTEMIGDIDLSLSVDTAVAVDDTYLEAEGGRPVKLKRTYDEIGVEVSVDYSVQDESGTNSESVESDLEGETVVFTRDGDGGYAVSFEGGDGDEQLLVGLIEDMDLRALLPTSEVSEDDEWKVPPTALKALLQPGGSLGMDTGEDDPDVAELMAVLEGLDVDALLESALTGEVTCTYKGVREGEAGRVAVIEIQVEIDSSTDLSALIRDLVESMGEDVPDDFALPTADLDLGMEGTGLLEWNLDGGHFQHFEANVETELSFHLVAEAEGQSVDASIGLSGGLELAADVAGR